ncbi:MAG: phosphotransferase family protein [Myxococcota bacterium]|nr:phosphotransferase family protein [Myxococcota bacterium]
MTMIDSPVEIRDGEALDTDTIQGFLMDTIPGLAGQMSIKQFPSGFSNLTYLIGFDNRELVLRRPPFGKKPKSGHDMSREYRILSALKPVYKYCPEPLVFAEDPAILGCPFYVMERIPGIILRKDLPQGMHLPPEAAQTLSEHLIDVFCELHAIDYKKIGLGDFGKPIGYVNRQVDGWIKRYRDARTDDAPDFEPVMAWLTEKMPPDAGKPAIIHNDFKFDNVVLNPENPLEIIGVLDWEMATIGDPLMDLGNSLAYWIEATDSDEMQAIRIIASNIEGMLTRKAQISRYCENTGTKVDNFDFYYCFGLFRLAVIAQQIYYRFFHGQTSDNRFGMLIFAVVVLNQTAEKLINASDL